MAKDFKLSNVSPNVILIFLKIFYNKILLNNNNLYKKNF